jgi:hypothetical protein
MTAQQIARFSKGWQYPFYDERDVWRRVKALGLDGGRKRIRLAAEQSLHEQWTLDVFIKLALDAVRNRIPLSEVVKEYRVGDGSGIRADMHFRLGRYEFFQETQRPGLTYQGWKAKMSKYLTYRKRSGPFRVLVVMEDEHNLNTALRYAKEVMKDRPNLTLFLFAWIPDLMSQYDTITEDVWRSHRWEPVALV